MNRSLPSALGQWYDHIEVIVVVDGPDPVTEQALAEAAAHDPRIRPVILPHNMGGSDARNAGVQAARGEWIAFLDDDDEWLPQNLAQQLTVALKAQQAGTVWPVSVCGSLTRSPGGELANPPRLPDPGEPLDEYILARRSFRERECSFMTSAIFCSRSLLLAHPFRSGLPRHQDWDWVLNVCKLPEVSFLFSQEIATVWYHGESRKQISNSLNWSRSLAWILEARQLGLVTDRSLVGFINRSVADYARRSGTYSAAFPLMKVMAQARPRAFEWVYFAAIWVTPSWARKLIRRVRMRRNQHDQNASVQTADPVQHAGHLPTHPHHGGAAK